MKFPIDDILASIPGPDREFGEIDDTVQDALDQIDNELMKRGTLNAEGLDWASVAEQAAVVLKQCAHLKGFHAAILALTHQPSSGDLAKSLQLATYMFAQAWQEMHPKSKRAGRLRDVWVGDIVGNLAGAIGYVCKAERAIPEESRVKALALVELASPHGVDVSDLNEALTAAKTPPAPQPEKPNGNTSSGEFIPRELNARDRAVLRKDIRSVADRITQFDPDAPVAYLMRGYAAWLEHKTLPENTDGVTGQQAMPAFILDEHQAAASDPDDAKLAKLEDRLFMSPDWFEGQKLADKMARRLGRENVANAICQRSVERVQSLPGLDKLQYANNKPYVSPDIAKWLESAAQTGPGKGQKDKGDKTPSQSVLSDTGDGDEANTKPSLEKVLRDTDDAVAKSTSGRETALAKFALAQEMAGHGLKSHARLIFDEILHEFGVAKLGEWDKSLLRDVQQARSKVG
ncbi:MULTISPECIES: type VI secretion system domain-containing protein [unclassified Thalassospira]|uniref:type VI secretion system domain-containing protein n=1 Tax=unclassified Thalassospira TaxID=2648997 RepID=UPI000A1F9DAE|nr:type VI secretion system domain-containing protein [Thalassospira sp. MCCC 1A01428]OSQ42986.1 hypothetical protein THS27_12575 [Thalassospira sp. MCCC 1A01428]